METAKVPAAVAAAAEELGIDLTQEAAKLWRNHPALVKLSEDMADPQQLPAGWSAHLDPMYNRFFYVDEATGTSVWQHPLHNYFMGAVFMARDGSHMLEENQKHHPPNDEEVEEMARYLGIQPEDPPAVREVARMAVCAPLPPGWEQYDLDGYDGYRNTGTGEEQEAHPLDDYFAELVRRRRAGVTARASTTSKAVHQRPPPQARLAHQPQQPPQPLTPQSGAPQRQPRSPQQQAQQQQSPGKEQQQQMPLHQPEQQQQQPQASGWGRSSLATTPVHSVQGTQTAHSLQSTIPPKHALDSASSSAVRNGRPITQPTSNTAQHSMAPAAPSKASGSQPAQAMSKGANSAAKPAPSAMPAPGPGKKTAGSSAKQATAAAAKPASGARNAKPAAEGEEEEDSSEYETDDEDEDEDDDEDDNDEDEEEEEATSEDESEAASSVAASTVTGSSATTVAQRVTSPVRTGSPLKSSNSNVNRLVVYQASADTSYRQGSPDPSQPSSRVGIDAGKPAAPVASSSEKIKVAVRARPLTQRKDKPAWDIDVAACTITVREGASLKRKAAFYGLGGASSGPSSVSSSRKDLWADQAASGSGTSTPGAGSGAKVSFRFDAVLDEGSKTAALYESCVRDIVRSALKGINGTVLAYGQTGSGKTHTIMGHRNDPGVIAMAIDGIFAVLGSAVDEYSMKVDMLEIYNEDLRDLLAEPTEHLSKCRQLHIKEDAMHGVTVSGLYEEPVNDPVRMKQLLERGNSRRQTSSHRMNHISSRSHALYQIAIERKRVHAGHAAQVSVLNFVDLAGSERLEKSGNENEVLRARESVNINLSLLMLGNVISKLAELGSAAHTTTATQSFVPYRNSKLTRILQPSLGGNARTAVIATINPSVNQAEETSHTLRFAARAMAVTNLVSVNKVITDGDLAKQYRHEADDLRRRLRLQRGGQDPYEDIHMLQSKLARLEDRNMSLQLQLESVTGRPADVRDSLPPTPPGLNLPAMHVRKGGEPLTADKALKMISRVAALSRGLNRNLGLYGAATPEAIVQAVRKMRAERDQLRWRDRDHRERLQDLQSELTELDEFRKDWPLLEEAVKVMEDLTGGRAAGVANSLPERLKDAVETAAMLSAELSSLERQHSTVALLLAQEQSRAKALQEDNTAMKAAVASASALQSSVARLTDENAALRKHKGAAGVAVPGEAALKMVDVMEKQVANMQARLDAHENDREALKSRLAELAGIATPEQAGGLSASSSAPTGANASPETTPRQQTPQQRAQNPSQPLVGSAAVRQARAAHARAKVAEVQLAKALAERDALSQKLAQLQPAKEPDSEKSGDSEDENDAIMQRLKQRVYTLSKEVATLKRERDALLHNLPSGITFPLALSPPASVPAASPGSHTASTPAAAAPSSLSPGSMSTSPNVTLGRSASLGQNQPSATAHADVANAIMSQLAALRSGGEVSTSNRGLDTHSYIPALRQMRTSADFLAAGLPSNHSSQASSKSASPKRSRRSPAAFFSSMLRQGPKTLKPKPQAAMQCSQSLTKIAKSGRSAFGTGSVQLPIPDWPPYSAQSLPLNGASGLALIPEKPKAAQGWVDPNDSGDPKLREIEALRKRLVAAERARADVVAKVAAEKRIVQMQLQGAQKAAMQAATLDKQLQEWEAKMAQTAHISEAMRAERDATAAQLQMMAEENARLRAGMEQISTHLQLSTVSGAGQAS